MSFCKMLVLLDKQNRIKPMSDNYFMWLKSIETAREKPRCSSAHSKWYGDFACLAERFIATPVNFPCESRGVLWMGMSKAGFLMTIGKWVKPLTGGFIHEQRIAVSNC